MIIKHSVEFETEFVLENMAPHMAEMVKQLTTEQLSAMCTYAVRESIKELGFIDKVAGKSTWGLLRLAGE